MEQVTKYIPTGLLLAFTAKLLIAGTSPAEMGTVFALTALVSLEKYLEKSKKIQNIEAEVQAKLAEVQKTVATQNEVIAKMAHELDSVRTNVTSIKMAQGIKRVGN